MPAQRRRSLAMTSALALAIAVAPFTASSPARADCNDSPRRGLDWSGCMKMSKVLANDDLRDSRFVRALLGWDSCLTSTEIPSGSPLLFADGFPTGEPPRCLSPRRHTCRKIL